MGANCRCFEATVVSGRGSEQNPRSQQLVQETAPMLTHSRQRRLPGAFSKALLAVSAIALAASIAACGSKEQAASPMPAPHAQLLIRNGVIFDGSGREPVRGDIAVNDGRVVAVGAGAQGYTSDQVVDAKGLAVAP